MACLRYLLQGRGRHYITFLLTCILVIVLHRLHQEPTSRNIPSNPGFTGFSGFNYLPAHVYSFAYGIYHRTNEMGSVPCPKPIDEESAIHPFTNYKLALDKPSVDFWPAIKTSYACPKKLLWALEPHNHTVTSRKYFCGIKINNQSNPRTCVIYSFSSGNNAEFEAGLLRATSCAVYMYNPVVQEERIPSKALSDGKFHPDGMTLGGIGPKNKTTLKNFMQINGHQWLDVVSIDMSTGAYQSVYQILQDFRKQKPFPIGQLIVKFKARESNFLIVLLGTLETLGFRLFANSMCCPATSEKYSTLSLINVKALDRIDLE